MQIAQGVCGTFSDKVIDAVEVPEKDRYCQTCVGSEFYDGERRVGG